MKQLADILAALFGKIGEFFDIFDLSFFVSGSLTLAAIGMLMYCQGVNFGPWFTNVVGVIGLAVGCYVSGLACFATGRQVRLLFARKTHHEQYFNRALLEAHGIHELEPARGYVARDSLPRLYVRLWTEVRQSRLAEPSFALLRRYWVLAATYDGIGTAAFIWMIAWLTLELGVGVPHVSRWAGFLLLPVFPLVAFSCFREASRFARYQAEELVATVAYLLDPLQQLHPAAPAVAGLARTVQVAALPAPVSPVLPAQAAPATPGEAGAPDSTPTT